jgi:hypothetical protein
VILLKGANADRLEIVTSASATIDAQASWMEAAGSGTPAPDADVLDSILSAKTTTLVSAPASGSTRYVTGVHVRNSHASTSCDVTVQVFGGTSSPSKGATIMKCTLLAGEALIMDAGGTWLHYDVNGGVYPAIGNIAVQADMEGASSTSVVVTPGRQHFHPSAAKCWGKTSVAAGTPTLQVSYNVTSITDTATDQLTVTIANVFSSANYACQVSIEAQTTTLSATTTSLAVFIRNATLLAGSFIIQACEFDIGAATDPSSWHWACFGDL